MPRIPILIAIQALSALLQVYFVSRISLIGKIGIALFYNEYRIFRSGWKTFLLFFTIQLMVIYVLRYMEKKGPARRAAFTSAVTGIIALIGLLLTYYDFQETYSHRLLKERFHLGFYLFWLSMAGTSIYFMVCNWPKKQEDAEV